MKIIKNKVSFILGIIIAFAGAGVLFSMIGLDLVYCASLENHMPVYWLLFIILPGCLGIILAIAGLGDKYRRRAVLVIEGFFFLIYLLVLFSILFGGFRRVSYDNITLFGDTKRYLELNTNFIPFRTIATYLRGLSGKDMNTSIAVENLVGNFIVFMPMAVFLPCLFSRLYKARYLVPILAAMIIGVEILQLVLHRGVLDVSDCTERNKICI